MEITRNGLQSSLEGPVEWFTGTVRLDPLFLKANDPARTAMTHVVIQEELDGSAVEWMEKVSDEQYGKS